MAAWYARFSVDRSARSLMTFDFEKLDYRQCYRLLISTVVPRPIALVTSLSRQGRVNAAPFSFFNVMGHDPPVLILGIEQGNDGQAKQTAKNIRQTHEFVVNLVSEAMLEGMLICANSFPEDHNELPEAGFHEAKASKVAVPLVAESPVSLECHEKMSIGIGEGRTLILGDILALHIDDDCFDTDTDHVRTESLNLIGRMQGKWYLRTKDVFSSS